jgi:TetR/AcrR family transcriptional regulator
VRVAQLFDRFETQLKQVIREAEMREGLRPAIPLPAAANLLMATAEGRISQYVRSGFKRSPTEDWKQQWELLMTGFFKEAVSQPVPGQGGFSQPLNQG